MKTEADISRSARRTQLLYDLMEHYKDDLTPLDMDDLMELIELESVDFDEGR